MASYTTLIHALSTLPSTIHSAFTFITAALSTVTPSVLISLAYRLFVLYAATRIIPAVRESGAQALSQEGSLDESEADVTNDGAGRLVGLLSWFSPTILIAVYTNLLMQHFASMSADPSNPNPTDPVARDWRSSPQAAAAGGNLWRWINLGTTMALYALELYLGDDDFDGGMTGHWKVD